MTDELFAYLMDDLAPERRAEVEQKLASDPAWQRELKRLQDCLAEGGDSRKCVDDPPHDLVLRTCCLVEKIGDSACGPPTRARGAAFTAAAPCCGGSRPWSFTDMVVGGGVLVLVAALATPALFETRAAARRVTCQNNLRAFGNALFNYQEARGHHLPPVEPGESAGMYAVKLAESGIITREQLREILICPESRLADDVFAGRAAPEVPSRTQLVQARNDQRAELLKRLGGSYAYRLGYYDSFGAYHQPPFTGEQGSPLMADAPLFTSTGIRSANHGGNGFNIVDQDMAVRFCTDSMFKGDNIYTNDEGEQAAGVEPQDIVLGPSDIGPDGPIVPIDLPRD